MMEVTVHGYTGPLFISDATQILSLALELAAQTDSAKADRLMKALRAAGFAYDEAFAGAYD